VLSKYNAGLDGKNDAKRCKARSDHCRDAVAGGVSITKVSSVSRVRMGGFASAALMRESEARTRYLSHAEERALIAEAGLRACPPAGKPDRRRFKGPRNDMMLSAAIVVALNSGLRCASNWT
jgi:hypothetical protein